MNQNAAAVGFYGKLPCRGDFLRRRVPQEFVDVWDTWMQESIAESWQQLQERWLEAYLTMPVWRFVLAEGICGTGAYAGVVLPSVDRVGRYFPLTIVARWNAEDSPIEAACSQQSWFETAEALAVQALEANDLDLDEFDEDVARLATQIDTGGLDETAYLRSIIQHSEFPHQPAQWHVPLTSAQSLQRAVNALALRELERTLRPLSLWWTDGSDDISPGMLCVRGLPEARSFAAMLSGDWVPSGWTSLDSRQAARPKLRTNSRAQSAGNDAPLPAPAFAAPPIHITACYEPPPREIGDAMRSAHFVSRPDLGLWGIAASDEENVDYSAAQAIADVLQSVPQAGTLTALVEEVRRALDGARDQLSRGSVYPAQGSQAPARAIVFLARGDECAVVCSGDVQAVRCRSAAVTPIIGVAHFDDAPVAPAVSNGSSYSSSAAGTLMDLLVGPSEPPAAPNGMNGLLHSQRSGAGNEIRVRYESLRVGDAWVIAGAPVFDEPQLPAVAAALAGQPAPAFSALRAACRPEEAAQNGTLPILLLSAARSTVEA